MNYPDRTALDSAVKALSRIGSSDPVSKMRGAEVAYRKAAAEYRARYEAVQAAEGLPVLV